MTRVVIIAHMDSHYELQIKQAPMYFIDPDLPDGAF